MRVDFLLLGNHHPFPRIAEPFMLYLGIDQHARQLTVSLRDQQGDVLLARQVSTRPAKVLKFFDQLTQRCAEAGEQFIAVLEVCGFNDWLICMLQDYRCHKVVLIQPKQRDRRKTDRRDAAALSELLWVNRERFLSGLCVGFRAHTLHLVGLPLPKQQFRAAGSALPGKASRMLMVRASLFLHYHGSEPG